MSQRMSVIPLGELGQQASQALQTSYHVTLIISIYFVRNKGPLNEGCKLSGANTMFVLIR